MPGKSFWKGVVTGAVLGTLLLAGASGLMALAFRGPLLRVLASAAETRLRVPPLTSGLQADYAWQIRDEHGAAYDMAETRGKVLFLHYFRPDCATCLAEVPAVNRLHEALREENVAFVCINLQKEGPGLLPGEALFPVYTLDGPAPPALQPGVTPTTFIVDTTGAICFKQEGGARWDDPAVMMYLRALAGAGTPRRE